jgi:7-cyano-7-deazaguanine synthase
LKKAIILSSGGVDSTTCVSLAVKRLGTENISTVSIFYGQKHKKELEAARAVARFYGVKHYEFDLASIFQYSNCALLSGSTETIEHKSYAEQIAENGTGKVSTYVPFRNGLMLSTAASLAASLYEDDEVDIYIGAHADDAAGDAYADCSEPFLKAMGDAISIGTYNKVHLVFPFANMNKAGVVKMGLELHTPYELTWSCYEGGEKPCGTCGTCIDRARAFAANGVKDPALK